MSNGYMHQAGLQQRGRGGGGGGYSNQKLNFKIHGGSCPTQHDNSKFPGPPPPKPSFRNSSFDCARRDPEGPQHYGPSARFGKEAIKMHTRELGPHVLRMERQAETRRMRMLPAGPMAENSAHRWLVSLCLSVSLSLCLSSS